jgi:hypothetical protein
MKNIAAVASTVVVLTAFCLLTLYPAADHVVRWEDFRSVLSSALWNISSAFWNIGLSAIGGSAVVWLLVKRRRTSAARGARSSLVARART